ncbi:hypothetical protein PoB_000472100 [Plakobranchus ocellatus]|uniref:Uncharacterized protein n=1 Tax=Plakobranchus ocellatus TaxID=259542 RepID=A0AAV3XSA1_9GAST|nr:hypothetical protein PoB_000472100 [Plakobranchus ocellatus]
MGEATTKTQALRETVTVVDRDQLISFQQEDPAIQGLVGARKTARRGNKTASFEKIKIIVYLRFEDPGRNISIKQVVLPKSLRGYVMEVPQKSSRFAAFELLYGRTIHISRELWTKEIEEPDVKSSYEDVTCGNDSTTPCRLLVRSYRRLRRSRSTIMTGRQGG